jgi:hypothetical protein
MTQRVGEAPTQYNKRSGENRGKERNENSH